MVEDVLRDAGPNLFDPTGWFCQKHSNEFKVFWAFCTLGYRAGYILIPFSFFRDIEQEVGWKKPLSVDVKCVLKLESYSLLGDKQE